MLKVGRTQLQDAVPMTVGQEFNAFAHTLGKDNRRLTDTAVLHEINLGGTAIGTGLNAHPHYPQAACRHLARLTGLPLTTAADLVEATSDTGAFVQVSGALKSLAVKLSKICNDLRLLASGPQAGLGELNLPRMQAGSSIMPGKVNPVIPEVVNQIAFEVIGNDTTVTLAAESGQLQLNAFEQVIAHCLLKSLDRLIAGCRTLAHRCINGITVNAAHLTRQTEENVGLIPALNNVIGYEAATALAHKALTSRRTVRDLLVDSGRLTPAEIDGLLTPSRLIIPSTPCRPKRRTGTGPSLRKEHPCPWTRRTPPAAGMMRSGASSSATTPARASAAASFMAGPS